MTIDVLNQYNIKRCMIIVLEKNIIQFSGIIITQKVERKSNVLNTRVNTREFKINPLFLVKEYKYIFLYRNIYLSYMPRVQVEQYDFEISAVINLCITFTYAHMHCRLV